ncbi:MAG TPA: Crp/Fnr family transcriptional regulator [Puia sp.]|jgi:CRP-like cAMP-binding protein
MTEIFTRYISRKGILTENECTRLLEIAFVRNIPKGDFLVREGKLWKLYAFLLEGCLRTYMVNEKGLERTTGFTTTGCWAGDGESLRSGRPSNYNIEALTNSTVLFIKNPDFETLAKSIPALNRLLAYVVDKNFMVTQERIYMIINYSAQQKYTAFLVRYGKESSHFSQTAIASYLGITLETLSRIKKALKTD